MGHKMFCDFCTDSRAQSFPQELHLPLKDSQNGHVILVSGCLSRDLAIATSSLQQPMSKKCNTFGSEVGSASISLCSVGKKDAGVASSYDMLKTAKTQFNEKKNSIFHSARHKRRANRKMYLKFNFVPHNRYS